MPEKKTRVVFSVLCLGIILCVLLLLKLLILDGVILFMYFFSFHEFTIYKILCLCHLCIVIAEPTYI